jgi:hypothetical protein
MKRFSIIIILSLACGCAVCSAAPKVKLSQEGSQCILTSGDATMCVDAGYGARVVSLKYAGHEILAARPEKVSFFNMHQFGATFWPSPQSVWNWPPIAAYDSAVYQLEASQDSFTLTSGTDARYPYKFVKKFSIDPKTGEFVIDYTIVNISDKPAKVAPWEITRVPGGGAIYFSAPKETIHPADLLPLEFSGKIVKIPYNTADENRKIFADCKGWLAFADNGLMLLKTFKDIPHEAAAEGEDDFEVYINKGKTYIELENQGAYLEIAPGSSYTWTVRWKVISLGRKDPEAILKKVKTGIK